jgi:hypothetical protein
MLTGAARYFDALFCRLNRKPVMTAMMVWSLVFGVLVLTADITVSRVNSACAMVPLDPNGAQGGTDVARHDFLVHQALQAQIVGVARKDSPASCPCVASSKWHWHLI